METMRDAFTATASALLDDDPSVAVVLADISADAFTAAHRRHPGRVINVGIREQLTSGVAGGLALTGMRPIVHSYAPFLVERPFEQLKLDLGHQDAGAVLVSIGASYDASTEGRTHQAPGDVAVLDTLPGWTVHVPGHPDEVPSLLRDAITSVARAYVRLSARTNEIPSRAAPGRFEVVRRGRSGTVVAAGPMLTPVLTAVEGLDVTVLYAATVRPFDAATLADTLDAPDVVLVEPYLAGTSSAEIADALRNVPHRLLAIGVPRAELRRYGTPGEHEAAHGLDPASLRVRIAGFLGE